MLHCEAYLQLQKVVTLCNTLVAGLHSFFVGGWLQTPSHFVQTPNIAERPFSTAPFSSLPGPVFNPGTSFVGNRSSPAYVNSPQDYISAGHLNMAGPPPSNVSGNMPPVNLGPAPPAGTGPYQAVYNMSPNSIPLGAGRPPMGMGF